MAEPKQERATRTREEILRAAAEVFDERGYNGASMREIMKRAGVTLGAVYFHFPSKEALARQVMNAQPATIIPRLGTEGLQRAVDITLVWARQLQEDPLLRAGVRLAVEQTSLQFEDTASYAEWRRIFEACLLEARANGELRDHVSTRETAEFLVGACTGLQLYSDLICRRADLPHRTAVMWELLLPGIAVESVAKSIEIGARQASALSD
ncbi:ScbR family autoregulator-binding transcription factor [Streptomyces sp. NPDC048106]|uniref:ScbR family autoregulator-binding transcription factor n=1 Tax=Streptomyces sp. NPDC048106 TaxID=3155750 RepID=UPI0034528747